MSEAWKTRTLGDVVQFAGGGTPSKKKEEYWTGEIPWVSPKDMKFRLITTSIDKVTEEGISNSSAKLIPTDSVLIVVRSGILSRTVPIGITTTELAVNQDLKALVPKHDVITSEYLYHFLASAEHQILRLVTRGATVHRLSTDHLKALSVPLPPLTEQQRIVSILDEAFEAIERAKENAQKNLANARELANSAIEATLLGQDGTVTNTRESGSQLLAAILEDRQTLWNRAEDEKIRVAPERAKRGKYSQPNPPEEVPDIQLPDNWTWASLDQLSYFIVDYRGKTPPLSDNGIPVVSAANIKDGEVCLEPPRYVSKETYDKWCVRGEPKGGDVIVTTEAPVGVTAIYPEGERYLLTRRVFAVRVAQCDPVYIHAVIESAFAQRFFGSHSHGATVPRILKPNLLSLPIPLPPLVAQIEIAQQIVRLKSRIQTLARLYEQKLHALDELKQSILQKAFTGKLTAKSPELEAV